MVEVESGSSQNGNEPQGWEPKSWDPQSWADVDPATVPSIVGEVPGPLSRHWYSRLESHTGGLSSQARLFRVAFEGGHGITLTDVDGNTYLDFSSGIYVASLGHCHPKVSEAVARAAQQLMNCHDFATPIRAQLCERLAEVTPGRLDLVQLYDSGTTAVEAGLRVARAATGRDEFIGFDNGFHGKTLAASSLGTPDAWHGIRAAGFHRVPGAYPYRSGTDDPIACSDRVLEGLDRYVRDHTSGQIAAIVVEPIQGWGGSVVPPDDFLPRLKAYCTSIGALFLADEVLTGFGRTGRLFAVEHWGVEPDIMTVGKGFGNGFPVTAIVVRDDLRPALDRASASTSYGGNPMACAAALASLEVIEEDGLLDHVTAVGAVMLGRLEDMKARHPIIGDVRGKGYLLGIELVKDRLTREPFTEAGIAVYQEAFRRGLAWIPAGHILRLAPPLIMSERMAIKGLDLVEEAIDVVERRLGYA